MSNFKMSTGISNHTLLITGGLGFDLAVMLYIRINEGLNQDLSRITRIDFMDYIVDRPMARTKGTG